MSLFQLFFIGVLFAVGLLYEEYKNFQRDKRDREDGINR